MRVSRGSLVCEGAIVSAALAYAVVRYEKNSAHVSFRAERLPETAALHVEKVGYTGALGSP